MHRTSLLLIYWPRIKPDKLLRRWRCKMKPNELYICFGHSWNQDSVGLNGYFQLPKSYHLKLSAVYLLSVLHVWAMTAQHTNNGKKRKLRCSSSRCWWANSFGVGEEDGQRDWVRQKGCNTLVLHPWIPETDRVWMEPWLSWNGEVPTLASLFTLENPPCNPRLLLIAEVC